MRVPSDGKRSREMDERERGINSRRQRHVWYTRFTITRRGRSLASYTRAFLSVCERDLFLRSSPTRRTDSAGPYARTYVCFGYLPADLRATSPASREARLPAVQTRRRSVYIHNASATVCVSLAASVRMRETAGGQVVITEIGVLECKVFRVPNKNNRWEATDELFIANGYKEMNYDGELCVI